MIERMMPKKQLGCYECMLWLALWLALVILKQMLCCDDVGIMR